MSVVSSRNSFPRKKKREWSTLVTRARRRLRQRSPLMAWTDPRHSAAITIRRRSSSSTAPRRCRAPIAAAANATTQPGVARALSKPVRLPGRQGFVASPVVVLVALEVAQARRKMSTLSSTPTPVMAPPPPPAPAETLSIGGCGEEGRRKNAVSPLPNR